MALLGFIEVMTNSLDFFGGKIVLFPNKPLVIPKGQDTLLGFLVPLIAGLAGGVVVAAPRDHGNSW